VLPILFAPAERGITTDPILFGLGVTPVTRPPVSSRPSFWEHARFIYEVANKFEI